MLKFSTADMAGELRQSEIITGIIQFSYDSVAEEVVQVRRPYTVLLSQDCDLLWDFEARSNGKPRELIGVLLYEAEPTPQIRGRLPGSDILRRIMRYGEDRYHLIPQVPPDQDLLGKGIPELIIDFRRYFTLPADEVYRQCAIEGDEGARRRCRLEMPYREHLQNRAAYYLQRVALPPD